MAKNTLEKNQLLTYFEIYKDNFFKLVILNIIFAGTLTFLLIGSFGIAYLLFSVLHFNAYLAPVATLPLLLLGPLAAAITKVTRDFVRREPGFMFADFRRALKDNFKQSIVIALLQYIIIWGLYIAVPFYYSAMNATEGTEHAFYTIGLGVSIFVGIIALFMSYYLYMMCVTLDLKIRELIKNSAIFSFLCLIRNILLTVILGIFTAIVYEWVIYTIYWKNALIWGLFISFMLLLFFGFFFYTISFFTFPPIKKHILDPYYKDHPELTDDVKPQTGDDIDYNGANSANAQSEYVYKDGRLVARSALTQENVFSDSVPIDSDREEKITPEKREEIKAKFKKKL